MAATIRADGGRGAQAEVDCERPRSAQPLQRSTAADSPWVERPRSRRLEVEMGRAGATRGGTDLRVGCVNELESQRKPRHGRSPAACLVDKPVQLQIGVLAMEAASEADSSARVALVRKHDGTHTSVCEPQWCQVAVGNWLVLQQPNMRGVESSVPYKAHDLLVEVWSTDDCAKTRDESDPTPRGKVGPYSPTPGPLMRRLGSLVVDCTAVSSGQGSIDSWFEITGPQGNTAAHVLLAVEQHVSADVSRRVTSLPPGWGKTPVIDAAERVIEVAKCIQQRRQRQSTTCTARFAAVETTRPARAHPTGWRSPHPVTGPEGRGRDCNEEITVEVNKACFGVRPLQHRSVQDGPLQKFNRRARDAGHSRPTVTRGPLKQQRPRRDTLKRAPDVSPATTAPCIVRATTTAAMASSTTPRCKRRREFALLTALL
eukprot:COSAG02_NODE_2535_length_8585_cov_3.664624_4_plen_429_part_00